MVDCVGCMHSLYTVKSYNSYKTIILYQNIYSLRAELYFCFKNIYIVNDRIIIKHKLCIRKKLPVNNIYYIYTFCAERNKLYRCVCRLYGNVIKLWLKRGRKKRLSSRAVEWGKVVTSLLP